MVDLNRYGAKPLSAPEFWSRALDDLAQVSRADLHRQSVERGIKVLHEEIWPLAMLARFLDAPERRVRCQYLGDDGSPCDGKFWLSGYEVDHGFTKPEFSIEVTSAQFPLEHLRREAMGLGDPVFLGPEIDAVGHKDDPDRKIVSKANARSVSEFVPETARWVQEAIGRKCAKEYPDPSILLVRVCPERRLSIRDWSEVLDQIVVPANGSPFDLIYTVDLSTGMVFHAV